MASVSDSPVSLANWRASRSADSFLMNRGIFSMYILPNTLYTTGQAQIVYAGNRSQIERSSVLFVFLISSLQGGLHVQAEFPDLLPLLARHARSHTHFLIHYASRNDPGQQGRNAGDRSRVNLWIESRRAAPSVRRCRDDSGLRRSAWQRHYTDGDYWF